MNIKGLEQIANNFDANDSYKLKQTGLKDQIKALSYITDVPNYKGQIGKFEGEFYIAYGTSAGNWMRISSNFTIWTAGTVTIDRSAKTLSVSSAVILYTSDQRTITIEGGSGVGSGLITGFTYYDSSAIKMLYVDILGVGVSQTVTLQMKRMTEVPDLSEGYQRFFLGAAYSDGNFYIPGLLDKEYHQRLLAIEPYIITSAESLVADENSDMSGANDWVANLNTPTLDINSTVAGKMYVKFSGIAQHQNVQIPDICEVGKTYRVEGKIRLNIGTATTIQIGGFSTTPNHAGSIYVTPTPTEQFFRGNIVASTAVVSIGVLSGDNNGLGIEVDDVKVREIVPSQEVLFESIDSIYADIETINADIDSIEADIASLEAVTTPIGESWGTMDFLQAIGKDDKELTKIAIMGDSLMVYNSGGAVVDGEGDLDVMPPRLYNNTFARRVYDYLKYNAPTYRAIRHTDWTLSGTWADENGSTLVNSGGSEYFKYTQEANAYAEISIPDGMDNVGLIIHIDDNENGQDYDDAVTVTINGSDPSAYGAATIDTYRTKDSALDTGNPFYVEQYIGLPTGSGANTIRLTKANNTKTLMVWGVMYWTGNTLMIMSCGHSGHELRTLIDEHLNAEIGENDVDAVLLQLPLMNNTAEHTTAETKSQIQEVIDFFDANDIRDYAFMSCNPMGDNGSGTNYYTLYAPPNQTYSMEDHSEATKQTCWDNKVPYINIFEFFRRKIENRGGTLEGGEGGLWYTQDGQHPDAVGFDLWFEMVKTTLLLNKPLTL